MRGARKGGTYPPRVHSEEAVSQHVDSGKWCCILGLTIGRTSKVEVRCQKSTYTSISSISRGGIGYTASEHKSAE